MDNLESPFKGCIKTMTKLDKLAFLGGRPTLKQRVPAYNTIGSEEKTATLRVMNSKNLSGFLGRAGDRFRGGPEVRAFEENFEKKFGVKHAISFNSATTALQAAIGALGIGPGDEVITTPMTMPATATAVLFNGAVPVFADVDEKNFCLDPQSVVKKINSRTKAIFAVNLFGGPADYDTLRLIAKRHNLKIIEDSAQAAGAKYKGQFAGTIGDIGVWSFNVHKIIQSGEGGMLTTNDDGYAYRAELIRNHGEAVVDDIWETKPEERELIAGSNFRLSELHAAIMGAQLKKLDSLIKNRINLADYLTKKIKASGLDWLIPFETPREIRCAHYLYPIRVQSKKIGLQRSTIAKALIAEGFAVQEGYQKPLYLMPIFKAKRIFPRTQFPFISKEFPHPDLDYKKGLCPVAERLYEQELFMVKVCQPPHTKRHIDALILGFKKIASNIRELQAWEKTQG